jgi:hypothetical protein
MVEEQPGFEGENVGELINDFHGGENRLTFDWDLSRF